MENEKSELSHSRSESLSDWIDKIADRFERAWRPGTPPKIPDFLEGHTGERRMALLKELVKIDIERRWLNGEQRGIQEYLAEFPELGSNGPSTAEELQSHVEQVRLQFETSSAAVPGSGQTADMAADINRLESSLERKRGTESPYRKLKEIAHGGMGAIVLCEDKALHRPVAMKVMRSRIAQSEEHRVRFLDEAQITGQLEHPNIVPVHELGRDEEANIYFTMKLVKGRSLGQILEELREQTKDQGPESRDQKQKAGVSVQVSEAASDTRHPTPETSDTGHHSPLTLTELLTIFLKACDGIAFAHSKGVIHRDLKPDNIMVGDFGEVLVMDWGLAKVLRTDQRPETGDQRPEEINAQDSASNAQHPSSDSGLREADTVPAQNTSRHTTSPSRQQSSSSTLIHSVRSVRSDTDIAATMEGAVHGTPAYMSPEQAEGKGDLIDPRSDIYSLGAVLYEILTLERPITGKTIHTILLKVSGGKILVPEKRSPGRAIPRELSAICMKAMEKHRYRRYQSVQDLSHDIRLFLEGRAVSAKDDSFLEFIEKVAKRNKAVCGSISAAVFVLLVVVTAFTIDNSQMRQEAEKARDEAQSATEKQVRTALDASEQLARQAERAAKEGRWEEARIRAEAAEQIFEAGPWGHFAFGIIAKERKELAEAESRFRKAINSDPSHPASRAELAQILARRGELEKVAILVAGEAGEQHWSILKDAGDRLYEEERYRDAEKAYQKALEQLLSSDRAPESEIR